MQVYEELVARGLIAQVPDRDEGRDRYRRDCAAAGFVQG